MITQSRLKELLKYNPETENFTWLVSKRNARIGSIAGYKTFMGYIYIQIDNRRFFAHRLAFFT